MDLITVTKANCAARMNYFEQLLLTLVVFKSVLLLVLLLSWLLPKAYKRLRAYRKWRSVPVHLRTANVRRRKRRTSVVDVRKFKVDWVRMFRVASMVLFIAYPSVSTKIMRLYNCRLVEGHYWLVADMRLQCFTGQWLAYAVYGAIMCVLYVGGLPFGILYVLWKRRDTLFGPRSAETMRTYGFLYDSYGPTAWFWETEELVRKLLLTAVAVLMDAGSPLQITMAVMISGWSHVMHAIYKPWGTASRTYLVQHLSLFTTTFLFTMGLLFKVNSVSQGVGSYRFLTVTMLMLCLLFVLAWVVEMTRGVARTLALRRRSSRLKRAGDDDASDANDRDDGDGAVLELTETTPTKVRQPSGADAPAVGHTAVQDAAVGSGGGDGVNSNGDRRASGRDAASSNTTRMALQDSEAGLPGTPPQDAKTSAEAAPPLMVHDSDGVAMPVEWRSNPLQAASAAVAARASGTRSGSATAVAARLGRRLSLSVAGAGGGGVSAGALKFFRSAVPGRK